MYVYACDSLIDWFVGCLLGILCSFSTVGLYCCLEKLLLSLVDVIRECV